MSDSDISETSSISGSDHSIICSYSKAFSSSTSDADETDEESRQNTFPCGVYMDVQTDEIFSPSLHNGIQMHPAVQKEFLMKNYPHIASRITETTANGFVFIYAPSDLAHTLESTSELHPPHTVLCDMCIFSKVEPVKIMTFSLKGDSKADEYNSQLTKSLVKLISNVEHNFSVVCGVFDNELCKDEKMFQVRLGELRTQAEKLCFPPALHMTDKKFQNVLKYFLDLHNEKKTEMADKELSLPESHQLQKTENSFVGCRSSKAEPVEQKLKPVSEVVSSSVGDGIRPTSPWSAEYDVHEVATTYQKNIFKEDDYKIFNDSVHGNIKMHPLCVKIIDTMEFQRLRQIKQLGAVQYVYPGAVHTRFEHSIGTCHLAEKWSKKLVETLQFEARKHITDQDILCVMIAGLCHDLGQGPLSDIFERYIENQKATDRIPLEERSIRMFEHMLEKNNLRSMMKTSYGINEDNIKDIKMMMKGNVEKMNGEERGQQWKYRVFLFEIVKNKRTGMDVDTWESLARDCLMLNIKNTFDYQRLIEMSRVISDTGGNMHICYRDKEIENIYKMFELCYDLKRQAYCHRVTYIISLMITDALIQAKRNLPIPGTDKKDQSLAECAGDMIAFTNVTDNIIWQITSSSSPYLKHPKEILESVANRRLYPSYRTKALEKMSKSTLHKKMSEKNHLARIMEITNKDKVYVSENDELIFDIMTLAYNRDEDEGDPTTWIHYYKKGHPTEITTDTSNEAIRLKPKSFHQYVIVLSCRDMHASKEKRNALEKALNQWYEENRMDTYIG